MSAAAQLTTPLLKTPEDYDLHDIYPPLDDAQKGKLHEMQGAVETMIAEGVEFPPSVITGLKRSPALLMTRFLVARQWNVANAAAMFKASAEFKVKNKFETTPLFPAACHVRGWDEEELIKFQGVGRREPGELDKFAETFKGTACSAWHKCDKDGRPIIIDRMGLARPAEILKRCKALTPPGGKLSHPTLTCHLHRSEVGGQILQYINREKYVAGQITVIIDCTGLTMGHLLGPAMELFKENTNTDKAYYPEGTARCYVVNAPVIVNAFYAIVKLWLDARMQQKIQFFRPKDTPAKLLEVIDAESLPSFLGGKCNCEGGCCPEMPKDLPPPEGGTVEVVVPAGRTLRRTSKVKAGAGVIWSMAITNNDIKFSVVFHPTGPDGQQLPHEHAKVIQDYGRMPAGETASGDYTAEVDGDVTFVLDNGFSWMKKKTVQFLVKSVDPTGDFDDVEQKDETTEGDAPQSPQTPAE